RMLCNVECAFGFWEELNVHIRITPRRRQRHWVAGGGAREGERVRGADHAPRTRELTKASRASYELQRRDVVDLIMKMKIAVTAPQPVNPLYRAVTSFIREVRVIAACCAAKGKPRFSASILHEIKKATWEQSHDFCIGWRSAFTPPIETQPAVT